jgi:hypothetical protein
MNETVELSLVNSGTCLISIEDSDLCNLRWYPDAEGYAIRYLPRVNRKQRFEKIHRVILSRMMGRPLARHEICDHINRDKRDNRRSNLRICTTVQNSQNQNKKPGSNPYKGVRFHPVAKKWQAQIRHNRKRLHLGLFLTAEEAARAYDRHAAIYFGKFANPNFTASEQ